MVADFHCISISTLLRDFVIDTPIDDNIPPSSFMSIYY